MTDTEANKALVKWYFTAIEDCDLTALDEIVSTDYQDHAPGRQPGREALKAAAQTLRGAFPDMTSTVTHMLAEGDLIAVRNRVTGTQHGPLGELPATGNRVDFAALQLFRVDDGLIVEHWEIFDETRLTQQLTTARVPARAAAATPTRISAPLIFVATNRLKPGQLDAERRRVPGLVEFVEQNEPQLIAFNEYVNDNGTEVTVVQVHPNAASMQKHLGIIGERAAQAYDETLDATVAIQVFGPVDPQMLTTMRTQTGEGVLLTAATEHLGGFTRGG